MTASGAFWIRSHTRRLWHMADRYEFRANDEPVKIWYALRCDESTTYRSEQLSDIEEELPSEVSDDDVCGRVPCGRIKEELDERGL